MPRLILSPHEIPGRLDEVETVAQWEPHHLLQDFILCCSYCEGSIFRLYMPVIMLQNDCGTSLWSALILDKDAL